MDGIAPKLPTDNLYKFIALSGLAVTLVSVFFMRSNINDLRELLFNIQRNSAHVSAMERDHERRTLLTEAIVKNFQTGADAVGAASDSKRDIFKALDELSQALLERDILVERKTSDLIQMKHLMQDEEIDRKLYQGTTCCGVLTTIVGFVLWYRRLQRYQDQLLLAELASIRTKSESDKAKV